MASRIENFWKTLGHKILGLYTLTNRLAACEDPPVPLNTHKPNFGQSPLTWLLFLGDR